MKKKNLAQAVRLLLLLQKKKKKKKKKREQLQQQEGGRALQVNSCVVLLFLQGLDDLLPQKRYRNQLMVHSWNG
jgi:hypothetical protein